MVRRIHHAAVLEQLQAQAQLQFAREPVIFRDRENCQKGRRPAYPVFQTATPNVLDLVFQKELRDQKSLEWISKIFSEKSPCLCSHFTGSSTSRELRGNEQPGNHRAACRFWIERESLQSGPWAVEPSLTSQSTTRASQPAREPRALVGPTGRFPTQR